MGQEASNPVIELRSVTTVSGGFEILRDVSVAFTEGVTTAVLGSAGSGKSALLKTAAGLVVPDSGAVLFRGSSLASFSEDEERYFRSRTSFVFQDAALWANQTIFFNIALPLRIHKPWMGESEVAERVRTTAERLGYVEGLAFRPADLSAGEQKLISIARALVLDPELVFLDEPASGLDEDAKERVQEVLDSLRDAGKSILLVTNDMGWVHRIADRLVIVRDGRLAAAGPYDEVVASEVPETAGLVARLRARGARGMRSRGAEESAGTVVLSDPEPPETGKSAGGAAEGERGT
ncbi:MAG: ATP-binding cassette domain-containing protein [Treponema sp.]|nr:ATP-binding cassette domain-containing protein [Treponema sp.]